MNRPNQSLGTDTPLHDAASRLLLRARQRQRYTFSKMKALLLLLVLSINTTLAHAETAGADVQAAIKQLYACHYFYDAGTRSKDAALQKKSTELANQFMLKATVVVVDSGGEKNVEKLSTEGKNEFISFINSIRAAPEETRDKKLEEFSAVCSSSLDSKIEYVRVDRNPQKAVQLFSCAHYFRTLANVEGATDSPKLVRIANEFLTKANALLVDSKGDTSASDLKQEGEAKSATFLASLSDSQNTGNKSDAKNAKREQKFKNLCARAGGIAIE